MYFLSSLILLTFPLASTAFAQAQQSVHDAAGRLGAVLDPTNGAAQYSYDATGNIVSVVRIPQTSPSIVQFTPTTGPVGTSVAILGTGFGTTANTTVKFNGVSATPSAVTANQVTVAVPSTSTSGPISVTSPAGTITTATSFVVGSPAKPSISGLSPGAVAPGGSVTVNGANFDTAVSKVFINNQSAVVTGATASALNVTVPNASSGHVFVETPTGSVTSTADFLIPPPNYAATTIGSHSRVALGQTASATITTAGTIALVLFDGSAGGRTSFWVTSSTISSGSICLYAPNGSQVGGCFGIGPGTFSFAQTLPSTGTYTLAVLPGSGATGTATLNLYSVPPDAGGPIAYGGTLTATVTTPGQNVRATFSGAAGDRVSLLTQLTGALASTCGTVYVIKPDGVNYLYAHFTCGGPDFTFLLVLPSSGTYTILYAPIGPVSSGSATLNLYNVPPDAGGPITEGGTLTATVTTPGQNVRATFSGAAGDRVSLLTQLTGSLQSTCGTVYVIEPDGVTNLYNHFTCSAADFTFLLVLPSSGTYTILFAPNGPVSSGSATLNLYSVPPDAGGPITYGGTLTATLTTPGQNVRATFSGATGDRISLLTQLTGSLQSTCSTIEVVEPDGQTTLYGHFTCSAADFTFLMVLPSSGTYGILDLPAGPVSSGSATLNLYNVPPDATGSVTIGGASLPLTTTVPGQNMLVTFAGTTNATAKISIAANPAYASSCYNVKISNPDNSVISNTLWCSPTYGTGVLTLTQNGVYQILIYSSGPTIGTTTTGVTAQ